MSVYDIDYSSSGLPNLLTPVRLRKPVQLAWLQALVSPVAYLKGLFTTNRTNNLYVLSHSGQVCYLQAVLNDVFDPVARGIYITDGPYVDPDFIYLADEDKPLYLDLVSEIGSSVIPAPDPVPLYTSLEIYTLGAQFIVMVPVAVTAATGYDIHRLKAIIDKYRLVSKNNYTVQTF